MTAPRKARFRKVVIKQPFMTKESKDTLLFMFFTVPTCTLVLSVPWLIDNEINDYVGIFFSLGIGYALSCILIAGLYLYHKIMNKEIIYEEI